VMLFFALVVLGLALRNEKQMSPWGTGFFVIVSGSMEPEIPVGSVILVNAVPAESIVVGDIIAYLSPNKEAVVTHRVVRIVNDFGNSPLFITRGDANNADDPPLRYGRVVGRVFYTIPGNNRVVRLLKDANSLGPMVIVAGVFLCIAGAFSSIKKRYAAEGGNPEDGSKDDNKKEDDDSKDDKITR